MFVRLVLALALLGLTSPATARAEPQPTHVITLRERFKAGDVFTRIVDETQTVKWKVLTEGGRESAQDGRVIYHAVGKVLEVDGAGHATKMVLYFVAWNMEGRGSQDGSLTGVHVEVAGRGNARTARVLSPGARITPAARQWLDERFGKPSAPVELGGRDPDDLFEPTQPLAVGETWRPDATRIASLLALSLPVVAEKVTVEATLESVEDDVVRVVVSLAIPLKGLLTGMGSPLLAWKEGGTVSRTIRSTRKLSSTFEHLRVEESRLEGIATAQGADVEFEQVTKSEMLVRAGGSLPAPPEPPASPAGAGPSGK